VAGSKGAHARGIAHQKSICFFLCDQDYDRGPIYALAVVKTIERRWLGRYLTAARAASGGLQLRARFRRWRWWQGLLLQAMDWHGKLRRNGSTAVARLGNGGSVLGSQGAIRVEFI
jgi:hypothetical protein